MHPSKALHPIDVTEEGIVIRKIYVHSVKRYGLIEVALGNDISIKDEQCEKLAFPNEVIWGNDAYCKDVQYEKAESPIEVAFLKCALGKDEQCEKAWDSIEVTY